MVTCVQSCERASCRLAINRQGFMFAHGIKFTLAILYSSLQCGGYIIIKLLYVLYFQMTLLGLTAATDRLKKYLNCARVPPISDIT